MNDKRTRRQKKKANMRLNFRIMIDDLAGPIEGRLVGLTVIDRIHFLETETRRLKAASQEVTDPELRKIIEAVRQRLTDRRIAIQSNLCPANPDEIKRPFSGPHSIQDSHYTSPKFVAVTYAKPVRG